MAYDQPKLTTSDTIAQKRAVTDFIDMIDPDKVPVIKYFGLDGSPEDHRIVNFPETKVEWLEDQLAPIDSSFNSGADVVFKSVAASTSKKITVADGTLVKTGDVLVTTETGNSDEVIGFVDDLSGNNVTLNVINYAEWTAAKATIGSKASFELIGIARDEGADADYERGLTSLSSSYNYAQIFQDDLKVSETEQVVQQYGIADSWDYQVSKKLPGMLRTIERAFFRGYRFAGEPRMMGGLNFYLSTNTASLSNAALQKSDIDDLLQDINESGGNPTVLICGNWVHRKISSWFEPYVRTERSEETGGVTINVISTHWGEVKILRSQWCPTDTLYLVEPEYIGFLPIRAFADEVLAKTGDSVKGQLVGEYTLVVRNEAAHGYITDISTTS